METHKHESEQSIGHHSMPSMNAKNTKALKITSWLTGIYFVLELSIGLYSGSISVISDAFHTFSAVGGVLLALIAGRIAMKPADKYKSFGSLRAEIIGALFNGFFLLIMAVIVLYMGYKRLLNPIELPTNLMLIAAAGGLITEVISIKLLYSGQKNNLNIKGAFWHVLQTLIGSLIIIVAALVIKFTGFLAIDPILGMLFGLVLFYASYGIIKDSLNILLESVPREIDLDEIKKSLESLKDVKNVHHIHAWALTSGKNIFSAHLLVDDSCKSEDVLREAHKLLKEKFNFYFSTIQIEKECSDEGEAKHIDIAK
jgi:cobalt-zinc-cadmium efflux system protein